MAERKNEISLKPEKYHLCMKNELDHNTSMRETNREWPLIAWTGINGDRAFRK